MKKELELTIFQKQILFSVLILLIIILLMWFIDYQQEKKFNPSEFKDITMIIKDNTLSKTGTTVIITDLSKTKNKYNEWYRIDRKVSGKWKELKGNDIWFDLVNRFVDQNSKLEMEINWESRYGSLEEGEYRLVKQVNDKYIAVEFVIK